MPTKMFKTPMLPSDFSLWIEQPLKSWRARHFHSFSASGLKGDQVVTLEVTLPLNPEKPSYVSFHAYPREDLEVEDSEDPIEEKNDAERAEKVFIYREAESVDDALSVFRALFVEGKAPAGDGWRQRDEILKAAEFSAETETIFDAKFFGDDSCEPEKALAALLARDLPAFEALASAGLEADALVSESNAEDAKSIPLLARYFKEVKDLSFALEAVRAYARHGYWLRSDTDEGVAVLEELSKHHADPQFLPVWKALFDTDRPFFHPDWEDDEWDDALFQAMLDVLCDLECDGRFDETEPLHCARGVSARLQKGLPYENLGLLGPVVGRRLSRVLIAAAPDKGDKAEAPELFDAQDMDGNDVLGLKGWAVLDFEGLPVVMQGSESVYTDPQALEIVSDPVDVSDLFQDAIGQRAILHRLTQDEDFYADGASYLHQRHTITFQNGACVVTGGAREMDFLRCFKPDWGEFRVTANGHLEQSLKAEGLTIWDAFHTDPLQLDDELLPDIALGNDAFAAHLDKVWKPWWRENRKSKRLVNWRVIHEKHNDIPAEAALSDFCRDYLDRPLPTEEPERSGLTADFATDRGVAVRVLRDFPEAFAKDLGLLMPSEDFHNHEKGCNEGVKLTKTIEEANAIAKERGWLISFRKD